MDSAFIVVDKIYMIEKDGSFSTGGRKPRFRPIGKMWRHADLLKHLQQWDKLPDVYVGTKVVELSMSSTGEFDITEAWLRAR